MPQTAAIIGCGLIGRSWATVFARAGWHVRVFDSVPAQMDRALDLIGASLADQQRAGLVDDPDAAAALVSTAPVLEDAVAGAAWVQENLPEDVDVKRDVFRALDAATTPDTLIASSTSAIPASRFTELLSGRARCLVAHPVNPPHLVPVVELCGAPWTAAATIERASAVMAGVGQVPIVVRREIDGFILNRLQGALLNEAMRLVGEGYVSPGDVDSTVAHGLGLRWSFMGPFATIDLNAPGGVVDYCARYSAIYRRLAGNPPGPDVWDETNVAAVVSALGEPMSAAQREQRMAWRDARLLALARHKADEPPV